MPEIEKQIAEIDRKILEIENLLSDPDYQGASSEDIQLQKYEAGAEAIAEYDPKEAMRLRTQAENIRLQRGKITQGIGERKAKAETAAQVREQKTSEDRIKQLAVQYRDSRRTRTKDIWENMPEDEKIQVDRELSGIRQTLSSSDFGKYLIGRVDKGASEKEILNTSEKAEAQPKKEISVNEIRDTITERSQDVDERDGIIDNIVGIESYIDDVTSGLGENDERVIQIKNHLSRLKKNISDKFQQSEQEEERKFGRAKIFRGEARAKTLEEERRQIDVEKRASKLTPIYGVFDRLKKEPNSKRAKADALNRLLRDESGAAIGKDEVQQRLQTVLPDAEYDNLMSEVGGIKGWIANATGNENLMMIRVMNDYLDKMNTDKLLDAISDRVIGDKKAFEYLEENYVPFSEQKQKPKIKIEGWK